MAKMYYEKEWQRNKQLIPHIIHYVRGKLLFGILIIFYDFPRHHALI